MSEPLAWPRTPARPNRPSVTAAACDTLPPALAPDWIDDTGPLYRIHGTDRDVIGAAHLSFAGDALLRPAGQPGLATLRDGDWLGGGTLRNSFYAEPWAQLAPLDDLHLVVSAQGTLRIRVLCASPGRPATPLAEFALHLPQPGRRSLALPRIGDLPRAARVFWHVEALSAAVLDDIAFATRTPPRRPARLAVLVRTHGRSDDARALLQRFAAAGATSAAHAAALDAMEFWLLDSSADALVKQATVCASGLALRVIHAPNLGGGGNASHLMTLARGDAAGRDDAPDEWLILDDDLSISFESLVRYRALCRWRVRDVAMSLPVLMKSQPTQVWEDGGLWGRFNAPNTHGLGRRRSVFPTLLKHGLALDDFSRLDDFGPLNEPEYATFIFYGLPRALAERLGPPVAFFLRGDDIEWSLRAREAGVCVVTNPNLCAWHEPAHSYAQEYMAILHAMIVNLRHADNPASDSVRFFEERLYEHAAIGDDAGLAVYLAVLEDLLADEPAVLSPQFAAHYPPRLAALNAPAMRTLPPAEHARLEAHARATGGAVLPFIHAGYHRPGADAPPVIVFNAASRGLRELHPRPFAERAPAMARYLALLGRLDGEFDTLRERWSARLDAAGGWAFWEAVQAEQAPHTRVLHRQARVLVRPPPLRLDAPAADEAGRTEAALGGALAARTADRAAAHTLAELRERLGRELDALQALHAAAQGLGPAPGASAPLSPVAPHAVTTAAGPPPRKRLPAWRRWLARRLGGALPAAATPVSMAELPRDFDPAQYLALNLDVARSGVDPAQHYLRFGRGEGRRYRLRPEVATR